MTKLAVVILLLTVLLVGCLVFTGNQLANYPRGIDDYKRAIFDGKDGTMVAFTDDVHGIPQAKTK